jgi:hypothetical protein
MKEKNRSDKMATWKQELAAEVTAIDDVTANMVTLTLRIKTLADLFGEGARYVFLTRQLKVKAPAPVSQRLVDGVNYQANDFTCDCAFLTVKEALTDRPDDPIITVNGVGKTLAEVRPADAAHGWGIDAGDDTISVGGADFTIVRVDGIKWLDAEPSVLRFTLRGVN